MVAYEMYATILFIGTQVGAHKKATAQHTDVCEQVAYCRATK